MSATALCLAEISSRFKFGILPSGISSRPLSVEAMIAVCFLRKSRSQALLEIQKSDEVGWKVGWKAQRSQTRRCDYVFVFCKRLDSRLSVLRAVRYLVVEIVD